MMRTSYSWQGETRVRCMKVNDVGELEVVSCPSHSSVTPTVRAQPGIGDVVAGGIKALGGPPPCGGCQKRQEALNRATPTWARRALAAVQRAFARP
jgi:hypothetical protein